MTDQLMTKLYKHTTEIRDIMFNAQSAYKIVNFLYRERSGVEIEVININQFLLYTAEINWRIYTIEMAKLFANRKSEHFNIHEYIKKFQPGREYRNINVSDSSILIWQQNLALTKDATWINNLLQQRDSKYSHTDRNREHIKNILSFADAKELLQIIQRMLSEVFHSVFGESMLFDPINEPVESLKQTVSILAARQQKLIDIEKNLK